MSGLAWRSLFGVLLVTMVAISSVFRVRARRRETVPRLAEGRALATLRTVLGAVLLAALIAAWVAPRALDGTRFGLAPGARGAGAAIAAAAIAFTAWTLAVLGPNVTETVLPKRRHELVTRGPYRWIRHPLYTGSTLFLAGLALLADSGLLLAAALAAAVLLRVAIVPREERELVARFGNRYLDLRRRTGALLPRPGRGGAPKARR